MEPAGSSVALETMKPPTLVDDEGGGGVTGIAKTQSQDGTAEVTTTGEDAAVPELPTDSDVVADEIMTNENTGDNITGDGPSDLLDAPPPSTMDGDQREGTEGEAGTSTDRPAALADATDGDAADVVVKFEAEEHTDPATGDECDAPDDGAVPEEQPGGQQPSSDSDSDDEYDEEEEEEGAAVAEVAPVATNAAAVAAVPPPPPQSVPAAAAAPERSVPITAAASSSNPSVPVPVPVSSLRATDAAAPAPTPAASASPAAAAAAAPLLLLTLPNDSLHCVASFLRPKSWSDLGQASRGANLACKEVFRRVRMHGFRCATEVVTAWARGQHSDARELTALYIKSGVPVYPLCLGHSYQTLTWRMGVEAREMDSDTGTGTNEEGAAGGAQGTQGALGGLGENPADATATNDGAEVGPTNGQTNNGAVKLDRFYTERYEARTQDGYYYPTMTYLEEKCTFWKHRSAEKDDYGGLGGIETLSLERRHSLTHGVSLRPPPPPLPGGGAGGPPPHPHHQRIGLPDLPQAQPNQPPAPGGPPLVGLAPTPPRRTLSSSNLASPYHPLSSRGQSSSQFHKNAAANAPRRPKMTVRTHKHLADRHLLGRRSVNDEDGSMKTAALSLSVDFFHPHLTASSAAAHHHAAAVYPSDMAPGSSSSSSPYGIPSGPPGMTRYQPGFPFGAAAATSAAAAAAASQSPPPWAPRWLPPGAAEVGLPGAAASAAGAPAMVPPETGAPVAVDPNAAAAVAGLVPPPQPFALAGRPHHHHLQHSVSFGPGPQMSQYGGGAHSHSVPVENSIVTDVTLEVYSSSSLGLPKAGGSGGGDARDDPSSPPAGSNGDAAGTTSGRALRSLHSRFSSYQRKLDSHLSHYQSSAFDECLLDFWDEFLPLTAGVHYYDGQTPVPRMSSLHRFLTSPCPKSLGIVQCEIERIKISTKKKGVNVKGRLFPSYEYRLFIRDRRHGSSESQTGPTDAPPRSDTVLMTAMNKGKNHLGAAGLSPAPSSSKRGVNNYYMYMPQQSDVDNHFKSVNDPSVTKDNADSAQAVAFQKLSPIGSGASSPLELGRLQSNFIGTEFQIFSPCIKKHRASAFNSSRSDSIGGGDSDNEFDSRSRVSGDTSENLPTSASRNPRRSSASGFRRRLSSSRRSLSRGRRGSTSSVAGDADDVSLASAPGRTRRGSWPALRPSRRAIANSIDSPPGQEESFLPVMGEEENGVITYTANLLGNRPRIMDVCIPKVLEDNSVSPEWRRHCDSSSERDDDKSESMMNRFKQLQQQGDNPDGANNDNPADSRTTPNEFGLMALQNRPPWWNVELGAFVLNFGGRVSVASVKNFQLCDRSDQEHIMLQFGRIQGRHSFTMDFQYPLSAMQAFAIAVSSLQSKISFG